jgi:hypothetical protein
MELENDKARTMALAEQAEQAAQPLQVLPQSSGPMRLLEMAVGRGASVEELEKLMALAERHDANEARKSYVAAMAKFKQNPPTIVKNKTAKMEKDGRALYSYQFADLAAVCGALVESLAQVGISHGWSVAQHGQAITVTCTLTHERGHSESVALSANADQSGGKNSIQAIGSAVKYLERYTLLAATGIAVQDSEDDDGAGAGISQQDRKELRQAAGEMRNGRSRPNPSEVAGRSKQAQAADAPLLANARAAADVGRDAFGVFWRELNGEKRNKLAAELDDLQARVDKAEAGKAA